MLCRSSVCTCIYLHLALPYFPPFCSGRATVAAVKLGNQVSIAPTVSVTGPREGRQSRGGGLVFGDCFLAFWCCSGAALWWSPPNLNAFLHLPPQAHSQQAHPPPDEPMPARGACRHCKRLLNLFQGPRCRLHGFLVVVSSPTARIPGSLAPWLLALRCCSFRS